MNNPFEYHSDGAESDRKSSWPKKCAYGCSSFFVFYPPIAATIAGLRFQGNFLWISLGMLSTIVLTAFFAWLILLILVFPIVGWAIHTRKPLPALIAVASLIYSGGIIGYCIKAIT